MSSKSEFIVDKCEYCSKWFTPNEDLSLRDGKPLHQECIELYAQRKEIEAFKTYHPYIDDMIISQLLFTEGYDELLNAFNSNPWIVLTLESNGKIFLFTAPDQITVGEYIKSYYESNDEIGIKVQEIYNNGIEYDYKLDVTVTLFESK